MIFQKTMSIALAAIGLALFIFGVGTSDAQTMLLVMAFIAKTGGVLFEIDNPHQQPKNSFFKNISVYGFLYLIILVSSKEQFLPLVAAGSLFLNLFGESQAAPWQGRAYKNSALTVTLAFFLLISASFLTVINPVYVVAAELIAFLVLILEEYFSIRRLKNCFITNTRILFYTFSTTIYFKIFFSSSNLTPQLKTVIEVLTAILFIFLFIEFIFQKEELRRFSVFASIWHLFIFWTAFSIRSEYYYLIIALGVFASWAWSITTQEKENAFQLASSYAAPGTIMFAPFIAVLVMIEQPNSFLWIWPAGISILWIFTALNEKDKTILINSKKQWVLVGLTGLCYLFLFNSSIIGEFFK